MDDVLENISNLVCVLDDILVITTGNQNQHLTKVVEVLQRLNENNMAVILSKCKFAGNQIHWLGYEVNENGIIPIFDKLEAIRSLPAPS